MTSLAELIKETSHYDKDNRYMAVSDIIKYLNDNHKVKEKYEERLCEAILKLLEDKNSEVKSIAVKCISELTKVVSVSMASLICTNLSDKLLNSDDSLEDIYSIGLINCFKSLPVDSSSIGLKILTKLLPSYLKTADGTLQDVISVIIERFFNDFAEKDKIFGSLNSFFLKSIETESSNLPLNSIQIKALLNSVAVMARSLEAKDSNLEKSLTIVSRHCASNSINLMTKALSFDYVSGILSSRTKPLASKSLATFLPLVQQQLTQTLDSVESQLACESGLQCLSSYLQLCSNEVFVSPLFSDLFKSCLELLEFDPNYSYSAEEKLLGDFTCKCPLKRKSETDLGGDMDVESESEEESEFEYDEDVEDFEDNSWKIRLACVKVLSLMAENDAVVTDIAEKLFERRIEREVKVREEIIILLKKVLLRTKYLWESTKQKIETVLKVLFWLLTVEEKKKYINTLVLTVNVLLGVIERVEIYENAGQKLDLFDLLICFYSSSMCLICENEKIEEEDRVFEQKYLLSLKKMCEIKSFEKKEKKMVFKLFKEELFKRALEGKSKEQVLALEILVSLYKTEGIIDQPELERVKEVLMELTRQQRDKEREAYVWLFKFVEAIGFQSVILKDDSLLNECWSFMKQRMTERKRDMLPVLTHFMEGVQNNGKLSIDSAELGQWVLEFLEVQADSEVLLSSLQLCVLVSSLGVIDEYVKAKVVILVENMEALTEKQQKTLLLLCKSIEFTSQQEKSIISALLNSKSTPSDAIKFLVTSLLLKSPENLSSFLASDHLAEDITSALDSKKAELGPKVALYVVNLIDVASEEKYCLELVKYLLTSQLEEEDVQDVSSVLEKVFVYYPQKVMNLLLQTTNTLFSLLFFGALAQTGTNLSLLSKSFKEVFSKSNSDCEYLDKRFVFSGLSDTLVVGSGLFLTGYEFLPGDATINENWRNLIEFLKNSQPDLLVKDELKEKVDFGPFKKTIDNGLPTRKAAFKLFQSFFEMEVKGFEARFQNSVFYLEEFLDYLIKGLEDDSDVQFICHDIVRALVKQVPLLFWKSPKCDKIGDVLCKMHSKKKKTAVDVSTSIKGLTAALAVSMQALDLNNKPLLSKFLSMN